VYKWARIAESKNTARKIIAEDGIICIGYMLRQEFKIYAYPTDKDTNGKAFHLYLRLTNGCGSMEDVLSIDCSTYQQRI